jgi:hypothetical protein
VAQLIDDPVIRSNIVRTIERTLYYSATSLVR